MMRLREKADKAIKTIAVILLVVMYVAAEVMDKISLGWVLLILMLAGIETGLLIILDRYGR